MRIIFARPDRGNAQSARSRLTDVIMVDRTVAAAAEIGSLRQELAAAKARIQEMGRRTSTLDDLRERLAALYQLILPPLSSHPLEDRVCHARRVYKKLNAAEASGDGAPDG
jgi:hypothetical protein